MDKEANCGSTRERDFGSHRGGFITMECTRHPGHDFRHKDDMGNTWDDEIPETPMLRREHEPKLCEGCLKRKAGYAGADCEEYMGFSCTMALELYNAGRSDFAAELGRTWPEEEECDLEPDEVLLRVAALLAEEGP